MRLDRAITLNLVDPLRRALVTRHASPVTSLPILMYHSISDDPERGVRPYYRVCTGPNRFREQMQYLKDNGCRGVTLSDGLAWLESKNGKQKTEIGNRKSEIADHQPSTINYQPVVLTFDDGFQDFHTTAWPILREFGFTATMYLPTAFIGNTRRQFQPSTINQQLSTGRHCLTWVEILELHHAGVEFGSHTVNHPKLVDLPWDKVQSELSDSKSEIEQRLGVCCPAFAYPYAFPQGNPAFARRFRDLVTTTGYQTCATTEIGRVKTGDNLYGLKRLPVNSLDDAALLAAKLAGSYDWLAPLQSGLKRIKSVITRKPTPSRTVHPIKPVPALK